MRNHADHNFPGSLVCEVENPIIANAHAPAIAVLQLLAARGNGLASSARIARATRLCAVASSRANSFFASRPILTRQLTRGSRDPSRPFGAARAVDAVATPAQVYRPDPEPTPYRPAVSRTRLPVPCASALGTRSQKPLPLPQSRSSRSILAALRFHLNLFLPSHTAWPFVTVGGLEVMLARRPRFSRAVRFATKKRSLPQQRQIDRHYARNDLAK